MGLIQTRIPVYTEEQAVETFGPCDIDGGNIEERREESDPNGIDAHQSGAKLDAGKSPVVQGAIQYFPRALLAVADVSGKGASKYSWRGWVDVDNGVARYTDALGRHLVAEALAKYDSDLPEVLHASQVAWNALARLELILIEEEKATEKQKPC